MVTPNRNLPPDSETWGRYVDKSIVELQKRMGIAKQNIITVNRQGAMAQEAAGVVTQKTEAVAEEAQETLSVVRKKNSSTLAVQPPDLPVHGDEWFDPADGNDPQVWVDYGPPRTNFVQNPTFHMDVSAWSTSNFTKAWDGKRFMRLTQGSAPPVDLLTGDDATGEGDAPEPGDELGEVFPGYVGITGYLMSTYIPGDVGPDPQAPPPPDEGDEDEEGFEDLGDDPPLEDTEPGIEPDPEDLEPGIDYVEPDLGPIGVPWAGSIDVTYLGDSEDASAQVVFLSDAQGSFDELIVSVSEVVPIPTGVSVRIAIEDGAHTENSVQLVVLFRGTEQGDVLHIDEATAEKAMSIDGPYFDGFSAGCEWSGQYPTRIATWDGNARWVSSRDTKLLDEALAAADAVLLQAQQEIDAAVSDLEANLGEFGKKQIFIDTVPPTAADLADEGAVRWQVDANNTIIGQWIMMGGLWTETTIRSEVIAELDVGQLRAGHAVINEAVIEKLWAEAIVVKFLTATEKIITTDVIATGAVTAAKITASEALWAKVIGTHKITAEEADLGSFTANTGFVAGLKSNILTVGSVSSDALALGLDELLPDPMWERQMVTLPSGGSYQWSVQYREGGQARVLRMNTPGIMSAQRAYLSESRAATPRERYFLRARVRSSSHNWSLVMGMEIQDKNGNRISDIIVSPKWDQPVNDTGEPIDEPAVLDAWVLNEYFALEGIVQVPEDGFRVRPFIGPSPDASPTAGYWWISQASWRSVPSTTSENGWVTMLTPNGLRVVTPEDRDAIVLGNFDDIGMTLFQTGVVLDEFDVPLLDDDGEPLVSEDPVVSITDEGYIGAKEMAATESLQYRGVELEDYLSTTPGGVAAYGQVAIGDTNNRLRLDDEYGLVSMEFNVTPGRIYQYVIETPSYVRDTMFYVRFREGASLSGAPTISNTNYDLYITAPWVSGYGKQTITGVIEPKANTREMQILLTARKRATSDTDCMVWGKTTIAIIDIGEPTYGSMQINPAGGEEYKEPAAPPKPKPPVPPSKKTYKRVFKRAWHKTWQQNGQAPRAAQNAAYQGRTPYYTAAGIYRSQVGVANMTSYLSGATIKKVRVRLKMTHSHSNSGGTVVIGTHGNSSRPSSYRNNSHNIIRSKFSKGQTKWLTMPSSTWAGWKSGSRRGLSFYINSTSTSYYVQVDPASVQVEVTYEK